MNASWKYTVFGECVKKAYAKYGYRNGENCVVWGNPRVDSIEKIKNLAVPAEWTLRIKGRKVILWTPHHTIDYGTFVEYKDVIFKYFEENNDMFLLLRPHPAMLKAIILNKLLTEDDVSNIKNMIAQSDNIILDTSSSYREAFSVSNAIITDGTSFLKEYMLLNRPILYTTTPTSLKQIFPEMNKAYHITVTMEQVLDFLDMVKAGDDFKQSIREEVTAQNFFMPSCGVGEYIKEQIFKTVVEEENAKIENPRKDLPEGRKLFLWGGGSHGRKAVDFFGKISKVAGVIDSNPLKHGQFLDGIEIYPPQKILESPIENRPFVIISSTVHKNEIKKELINAGFVEEQDFRIY
jgi:hypothetical protein